MQYGESGGSCITYAQKMMSLFVLKKMSVYMPKSIPQTREWYSYAWKTTGKWAGPLGGGWQLPWSAECVARVTSLGALWLRWCCGGESLCDPAGRLLQHGFGHVWEVVVKGMVASLIDLNRKLETSENQRGGIHTMRIKEVGYTPWESEL